MKKLTILLCAILMCTTASAQEWTEHAVDSEFEGANCVYAADVDNDGDIDVLGAAIFADDITWWENLDGTGLVWFEHIVDGEYDGVQSVYAADMDGDGDIDVLGAAYSVDEITWWENLDGNGLSWAEHVVDENFNGCRKAYAADVDGDGDMDVLGAASSSDMIAWWENLDGTGLNWSEHIVDEMYNYAHCVFTADVNGDGNMDVLGAACIDGIVWWENLDGTGLNWSEHVVDEMFDCAVNVYAADVDNDGDIDVLGAARNVNDTDDIAWWENVDGDGLNWSEHSLDENYDGAWGVHATDMDGDGDVDILSSAQHAQEITYWENLDGTGLTWFEHTVDDSFDMARGVFAEDVDGDGDIDVLGAALFADDIAWWEQLGSPDLIDISLTAPNPLIVPRGGSFQYEALVTSNLPSPYNVDFWTYVSLPNGSPYGPLQRINNVPMTPTTIIGPVNLGLAIPQTAVLGEYTFHMQAGRFPATVVGEDEFPFEVVAATGTNGLPSSDWSAWGLDQLHQTSSEETVTDVATPTTYSLAGAYPNPFNASTTLTVNLPEIAELTVVVYNTLGQEVVRIADGTMSAGKHDFSFNASTLSSGVYFVQVRVPGKLDELRKVVLMK